MIRRKVPDYKNALSIIQAAERDIKFTLTLKPTEEAGSTIVRNIYESFRMLGDALLVAKGIKSEDHIMPIRELLQLKVNTLMPLQLIDNLRRLRHNINYYGYKPTLMEVNEVISIAKAMFDPIFKEVNKKILQR